MLSHVIFLFPKIRGLIEKGFLVAFETSGALGNLWIPDGITSQSKFNFQFNQAHFETFKQFGMEINLLVIDASSICTSLKENF